MMKPFKSGYPGFMLAKSVQRLNHAGTKCASLLVHRRALSSGLRVEHLAWIHQVVRVQCAFDTAHDVQFDRRFVAGDFFAL